MHQTIIAGLKISKDLADLIEVEIAPGTGIDPQAFWTAFSEMVRDLGPKNRALLQKRDLIQRKIDTWHIEHRGEPYAIDDYQSYLNEIGYLRPEGSDVNIRTDQVDVEISRIAGPQLVVPVDNARYAINAANARWGSLFDAIYGTDVIPEENGAEKGDGYNPVRGRQVIDYAWCFLDEAVPLINASYQSAAAFLIESGDNQKRLRVTLEDGSHTTLSDPLKWVGYRTGEKGTQCILLKNNGLHIELQFDRNHPVGKTHSSGIRDIIMEAAITTIQDCEDSVAAVDAEDKAAVYRNWLGLMLGHLTATFVKNGRRMTRRLATDRSYSDRDGNRFDLPGRSLMLVRNVGIHMYTDAVTTTDGEEVPEGFLDAMVTSLIAVHDLKRNGDFRNSRSGSIYIVKPKLHGPEEVAATVELFERVEQALHLAPNTIKIGIMDEERRTTVNLKACIRAAMDRVVFINTGFLDRTGDEIHTMMQAGPVLAKSELKTCTWMQAYENWNVDIGIECGLPGRAQIGKGMWAMPDEMQQMVKSKITHPESGATTAWVPSPNAATLHAMHYHQVNVQERLKMISRRTKAGLKDILTIPLLNREELSEKAVQSELENNAQGILGYVSRWVGQGVGCSKVPDVSDTGLMEDRATLRIASQLLGNWLHHGVIDKPQMINAFKKMALVVDRQNASDDHYRPMAPNYEKSIEFQTALELVFNAVMTPNGYTESVLHRQRRAAKRLSA